MKQFFKNNIVFFVYYVFAIIIELSGIYVMSNKSYIRNPFFLITLSLITFSIYNFIKSRKAKIITLSTLLIIQAILSIVFVALYDNTGGTYFDFNMLKLIGSNNNFVVTITINWAFIFYIIFILTFFICSVIFLRNYQDLKYRPKSSVITASVCLMISIISHSAIVINCNQINEKKFINSLYKDTNDKYINLGSSGNAINEIYKMLFFNKYNKLSNEQINNYIYEEISEPTSKFGVAADNNLVTILVESFEWFAFISDVNAYPNGANLDNETLNALYPNLREFYNMSVVMNNHHSENKTDMSEDEALLGVYSSSDYINYSFANNTLPTSIANVLKEKDTNIKTNFFHNNDITFYNRNKFSTSLGYDNLYFIDEMVEKGVTNYMKDASVEGMAMNLDSEMFETMKDDMFLANERFVTHITTVSMHGDYVYRKNMQRWYDKMDSLNINIENNYLKNYMAYVMDFDYAIGVMLEDLKSKNLLEKTTIVIFSDHNAYMNHLTNYVKDINDYTDNYNELFRVPLMIYDSNIGHQVINKFTTTYDIVPTVLDMFGINYYKNLYYGNSIFSDEESILYSKAFDVFISDGLYFSNINNILYKDSKINSDHIKEIENKCLALLKKIYYTNHIFYYDYFKNDNNYATYINSTNSIN